MIIKSERLLTRVEPAADDPQALAYAQYDEDDELLFAVHMSVEDYEAFGRPSEITVTIQPGDLLNTEDASEYCRA